MALVKSVRIQISRCEELDYKRMSSIFRDIRYKTCRASNEAMRLFLLNAFQSIRYKELHDIYPDIKSLTGKSLNTYIYNSMKEIMDICQTGNVSQTQQFVKNRFNTDIKDLLVNEVSYTNFKKDMPLFLHNKSYAICKDEDSGKYKVECSLFNRQYQKENNIKRVTFVLGKMDGNQKATLGKIIAGGYKQGAGHIKQDKKKKWYFTINYSFEPQIRKINTNRILGVDLGMVNTAVLQIWDIDKQKWDWLEWKECMLDGGKVYNFNQRVEGMKRSLQRSRKVSSVTSPYSKGKKGRGVQARIKALNRLNHKISNFKDTINHQYSKYIIDFALKHNCGIIQMEDLSKIKDKAEEKFLAHWTYYDLQSKIGYKAKAHGIKVVKIKPAYTSLRCSKCGHIDKENRKEQAKFKCVKCKYKLHADVNAARNIAIPEIERLIEIEKEEVNAI